MQSHLRRERSSVLPASPRCSVSLHWSQQFDSIISNFTAPGLGLFEVHRFFILILGTAFTSLLMAETGTLDSLGDLRWKNRVILVDAATETMIGQLEARQPEMDERQLLWFCVVSGEIHTNYGGELGDGLLGQLNDGYLHKYGFPVLLIGKDGGIKSRDQTLDIDSYLIQIDSMPMRQSEMDASRTK